MKYILKYFPLKFIDDEEESNFRLFHLNLRYLRLILVISSVTYVSFLLVDLIVYPEFFFYFVIVRFGLVFPFLFIVYALTYTEFFLRKGNFLLIVTCSVVALSISLMQYIARGTELAGYYFFGLVQVLIFLYGFGKIVSHHALISGLLITVVSIVLDAIFIDQRFEFIVLKFSLLASMVIIGFFITYIIELASRRNYIYRKELENLSWTDALTGLKNRHFFNRFILQDLNRFIMNNENSISRLNQGMMICIVLFDVDDFKSINDTYGHEAGDIVLKQIGEKMTELSRKNDYVVRWGGEEFLVIINGIDEENVYPIIMRIRHGLSEYIYNIGSNRKIPVTLSGGMIKLIPGGNEGVSNFLDLFNLIDAAMYTSKTNGKDKIYEARYSAEDDEYIYINVR